MTPFRLETGVNQLFGLAALVLCATIGPAAAATFTVTNAGDAGTGSLRQAILEANAAPGADLIAFAIPGAGPQQILPASPLPAVTDPVVIQGNFIGVDISGTVALPNEDAGIMIDLKQGVRSCIVHATSPIVLELDTQALDERREWRARLADSEVTDRISLL